MQVSNTNQNTGSYPMIPMRDMVVFPYTTTFFNVGRPHSIVALKNALATNRIIFLATQYDATLKEPAPSQVYRIGTLVRISEHIDLANGSIKVKVEGIESAKIIYIEEIEGYWQAHVASTPVMLESNPKIDGLVVQLKSLVNEYSQESPQNKDLLADFFNISDHLRLVNYIAAHIQIAVEKKQNVLESLSLSDRLVKLIKILEEKFDKQSYSSISDPQDQHFLRVNKSDKLIEGLHEAHLWLQDTNSEKELCTRLKILLTHFQYERLRIVIFGNFNRGKSTLINALFGMQLVPTDLIPLTGAAIRIVYGTQLQTTIKFKGEKYIQDFGTKLLEQFAILDDSGLRPKDVTDVEVQIPSNFLKRGIEIVDLPGTDDPNQQDTFLFDELLKADLVLMLLDATKQFTLQEKNLVNDMLIARSIEQIIFVVNKCNILEPEEATQAYQAMQAEINDFPNSQRFKCYRVDVKPALQALIKGNLPTFGLDLLLEELNKWSTPSKDSLQKIRLSRILNISDDITNLLNPVYETTKAQFYDVKSRQSKYIRLFTYLQSVKITCSTIYKLNAEIPDKFTTKAKQAIENGNYRTWAKQYLLQYFDKEKNDLNTILSAILKETNFSVDLLEINLSEPILPTLPLKPAPVSLKASDVVKGAIGLVAAIFGDYRTVMIAQQSMSEYTNAQRLQAKAEEEYKLKCEELYSKTAKEWLINFSISITKQLDTIIKKTENIANKFQPVQVNTIEMEKKMEKLENVLQKVNKKLLI